MSLGSSGMGMSGGSSRTRMNLLQAAGLVVAAAALPRLVPWTEVPGGLVPDLVVATVVVLAVRLERSTAIWLAALAGIVDDGLAATPFGVRTLVLVAIAWAAGSIARAVDPEPLPMRLALLGSASVAASWLEVTVLRQLDPSNPLLGAVLLDGLAMRALATAVVGALFCAPFARTPWVGTSSAGSFRGSAW